MLLWQCVRNTRGRFDSVILAEVSCYFTLLSKNMKENNDHRNTITLFIM